jgi:hypothetical protein
MGVTGVAEADDVAVVVGAADDVVVADALVWGAFWADAFVGAFWNASRLPIRAVASARAPMRTPIRWFRLRRAARAWRVSRELRFAGRLLPEDGGRRGGPAGTGCVWSERGAAPLRDVAACRGGVGPDFARLDATPGFDVGWDRRAAAARFGFLRPRPLTPPPFRPAQAPVAADRRIVHGRMTCGNPFERGRCGARLRRTACR